jgi:hypothetical protein
MKECGISYKRRAIVAQDMGIRIMKASHHPGKIVVVIVIKGFEYAIGTSLANFFDNLSFYT